MEPDKFSGIIGLGIHIVLCNKVNMHKAEILPKTMHPFPLYKSTIFPKQGFGYQFLRESPRQSAPTEHLNNGSFFF